MCTLAFKRLRRPQVFFDGSKYKKKKELWEKEKNEKLDAYVTLSR